MPNFDDLMNKLDAPSAEAWRPETEGDIIAHRWTK